MEPTALDKLIGYISPERGARRMAYRQRMEILSSYEGASKGRRTKNWRTSSGSANAETRSALGTLRDRSRDLVRNNPYAAAAAREIPSHTVGAGIIPQAEARNTRATNRAEQLVKQWFDTTACDADGHHTFYGLQSLAMRTVFESGECLIRRRNRRREGRLPVPMQLQVMEPDHLDMTMDGQRNGENIIIQGVEFNPNGQRVAYWLFPHHPGEMTPFRYGLTSRRIPADEIIHLYRMERPGQVRGVPWTAPIIMRLRDFDEYEDAQLTRQKIAACYTAFMYDSDPMAGSSGEDPVLPDKLEPGTIEELPAGKDVRFADPPTVEGYDTYSTVTLHAVATGLGVPYSLLTGDLRQVNFSSGRMGRLDFHRSVEQWRWNMLIPQMCMGVWQWFSQLAQMEGNTGPLDVTWTPPRREMVDPSREVPAIRDAVRSGLMTQSEAIREQGYDPADFWTERERDQQEMDQRGIALDSDPRKVSTAGVTQARPADSELPPTSED